MSAPRRVYLDSGALIVAALGQAGPGLRRLLESDETEVTFLASFMTWLEVIPKPTFNKYTNQVAFYERQRDQSVHVPINDAMLAYAFQTAVKYGLGGPDGLHLACAVTEKADLFVTTERGTRPMHRVTEVRVVHVDALDELFR